MNLSPNPYDDCEMNTRMEVWLRINLSSALTLVLSGLNDDSGKDSF